MGLCGECLRGRLMEYRDKVEQEFSWKSKELWFSNPFFFAIRCQRPLISETIINDIKLMKHSCFLFTPPPFFMFLIHPAPLLHVSYSPFPPSSCFLFTPPLFFMFLIHPSPFFMFLIHPSPLLHVSYSPLPCFGIIKSNQEWQGRIRKRLLGNHANRYLHDMYVLF